MKSTESLIRYAWREDERNDATFYSDRDALDTLLVAKLSELPEDHQPDFLRALPLPEYDSNAGPYYEVDEDDAEARLRVATLFSCAAALETISRIHPHSFRLVLERPWPDPNVTEGVFWLEWDRLFARLDRTTRGCSADEARALVRASEWAAVAAAAHLHPDPDVLAECASRAHWFDPTAMHATRGFLLLNPCLPLETRTQILSHMAAEDWFWAGQRLPYVEHAFTTTLDPYKWDAVTDLWVDGPVVTEEAMELLTRAALLAFEKDPGCMRNSDEWWDEAYGLFGTLAAQPTLGDELLREILRLLGPPVAGFVLRNPSASDELRAVASLTEDENAIHR